MVWRHFKHGVQQLIHMSLPHSNSTSKKGTQQQPGLVKIQMQDTKSSISRRAGPPSFLYFEVSPKHLLRIKDLLGALFPMQIPDICNFISMSLVYSSPSDNKDMLFTKTTIDNLGIMRQLLGPACTLMSAMNP